MSVQRNELGVGGREFRVKRNPIGEGAFVYDPRTRFSGVERYLVWWVDREGKAYPLNSPSKMVTPGLPWPREDGVDAPSTDAVVEYVFRGRPMTAPARRDPVSPATSTFTVTEYRIYRALVDTPMSVSEEEALKSIAGRYAVTPKQARAASKKVQKALYANGWFSSSESEIKYASDWKVPGGG